MTSRPRLHGRASWHRRSAAPIRIWMGVLLVVILVHRWVPDFRWVMVHLVTLGLITNSIMVWSQHFTESLLKNRLPDGARRRQLARIRTLNVGIVLLIAGLLSTWYWLTVLAAVLIGAALTWHGTALLGQLRTALPSRFAVTVKYYVVAAFLLPVGAVLGAVLAAGLSAPWHARVLLAHEATNVLGFVGLTVAGTLLTLWPTILRTRMVGFSSRITAVALPVMTGGIVTTVGGSLLGTVWVTVAGLAAYICGLVAVAVVMAGTACRRRPADYAGFSVAAGVMWWLATTVVITWLVAGHGFETAVLRQLTVPFVAGFLAQVLLGAMTYLLPVTMGGGPATVRAANQVINRAAMFRVVVINLCVLLFSLPPGLLPSWVRAVVSVLGAAVFFAFVPLMVSAAKVSVAGRKAAAAPPSRNRARADTSAPSPAAPGGEVPASRHVRGAVAGVLTVATAVVVGIALNPAAAGFDLRAQGAGPVQATGRTTTVEVSAEEGMRFEPASVEVPVGDELVIELTNNDPTNVHDLVLASGASSGRVALGQTVTVDAGVIGGSVEGWCSIVGHKSMGMGFDVIAVDADGTAVAAAPAAAQEAPGHPGLHAPASDPAADPAADPDPAVDFGAAPGDQFDTRSPVLEPVDGEPESGRRVHRVELEVEEIPQEIAPGMQLQGWTYNGRYMGPTLHGRVGDVFEITLVNDGSMGHSVDFHAGALAPDGPMRTIAPGESLVYRFEAVRSGIWLYHCSTAPMSTHLAAGMFGAVVIDPPGLPGVDREFLLVQNETYLSPAGDTADGGANAVVAPERVAQGVPSLTMFNGHATQYVHDPLTARTGERVRIWVLAAGPSKGMSFHVVGGQFDTVYKEGAYLLPPGGTGQGGAQVLDLAPAQGGFVELEFSEPGTYPFVNHSLAEAERGARGLIRVSP